MLRIPSEQHLQKFVVFCLSKQTMGGKYEKMRKQPPTMEERAQNTVQSQFLDDQGLMQNTKWNRI